MPPRKAGSSSVCHSIVRFRNAFSAGKAAAASATPSTVATSTCTKTSLMNCANSARRLPPQALRTPTSVERRSASAVRSVTKLIAAASTISAPMPIAP